MAYMSAVEILSFTSINIEVIFFYQANKGKSKHILSDDDGLLKELEAVKKDMGLKDEEIHVVAHGTGCELALSHALRGRKNKGPVHSLTVIGAGSSSERNRIDFENILANE